jgi:ATP-dependent Clp protease adapter protein ClpS
METDTIKETDIANLLGKPFNLILFNDESHGMDEVAFQIIKAIKCSQERALSIMMEAHIKGRAVVFTGNRERCEHVEAILAEIQLRTVIEPA